MFDSNRYRDLDPGIRTLMGPGPSDVEARVLNAMSAPCVGHLDPYFISVMDEVQQLLRYVFQTENELTIPMSGTGSSGMETCFVNLVEPGDEVLVGFHAILAADSERSGFHLQATPGYMSPVCLEYLLAIAQSTTMPEVLDLVLQAALSADNESLRPFASRAEDVLDARPVVLPQTRTRDPRLTKAWSRQVKRLVFLLCAGDANTRARAMERLEMMYDATPQLRRTEFILDLRWCMNRRAIPLLARAVEDAPGEAERLIAATSLLAVEAGVVPE